jgi:hypothetical protein
VASAGDRTLDEHSQYGGEVSRRERQQQQVAAALARRHYARVLVLAREHLAEFPDDDDVRDAAVVALGFWERPDFFEPPQYDA